MAHSYPNCSLVGVDGDAHSIDIARERLSDEGVLAEGCRTIPARIMSGIQFFEATIDDQSLPVKAYLDLLNRHGFWNVDFVSITPVHVLTYGQK